jgi:predicted SAM-dependent methyltransferase
VSNESVDPCLPEVTADCHKRIDGANLTVQFGCGWSAPESWRNFDASPTLRFERVPILGRLHTKNASRFPANVEYGDIVKGLPIGAQSCRAVYCSHVLEHLCLADFRVALRNTHRVLRPGGIFRLVLPDLRYSIDQYVAGSACNAAMIFMEQTALGQARRTRGLRSLLAASLGNSSHRWMWDYESMQTELENAGFVEVRRASFHDSSESCFLDVEDWGRWENCLGAECKRPASETRQISPEGQKRALPRDSGRLNDQDDQLLN